MILRWLCRPETMPRWAVIVIVALAVVLGMSLGLRLWWRR